MTLHTFGIALLASTVAIQIASSQEQTFPRDPSGVSMMVRSSIGAVGSPCEAFDCMAHQTLAAPGERLAIEVYALADSPYVLFLGMPTPGCQAVPQLAGALGLWAPIVTLEFGIVSAVSSAGACPATLAATALVVPTTVSLGMQFRLQAFGFGMAGEGLGFTRAVEVHTR